MSAKKISKFLKKEIPGQKIAWKAIIIGVIMYAFGWIFGWWIDSETADIAGQIVWFSGMLLVLSGFVILLLMIAEKTKQYRYYISYLLDDLPVGTKFKPSALHITVLPWFAIETDEQPFIEWFYKHFDAIDSFEAVVGEPMMFGPKKDVPVNLIGPKEKFLELHSLALSWFGELGAHWAEKDPYVGDDYLPHIAQRRGFVLEEGQIIPINSLVLVKANRREDHVRTVAAKALFNGQN